jgi:exopolysaccharide biosynthesis polyprenyl glycosylphosphotransferase
MTTLDLLRRGSRAEPDAQLVRPVRAPSAALLAVDLIALGTVLLGVGLLVGDASALLLATLVAVTAPIGFAVSELYGSVRSKGDAIGELRRTTAAIAAAVLGWLVVGLIATPDEVGRGIGAVAAAAVLVAGPVTIATRRAARSKLARRSPERVLIIGAGEAGQTIAAQIAAGSNGEVEVAGFVDDDPRPLREDVGNLPVLPEADLVRAIDETRATRVVLAYTRRPAAEVLAQIRECSSGDIRLAVVPRLYEMTPSHASVSEIGGLPVIDLASARLSPAAVRAKRVMDVVITSAVLAVFGPLMLLIAAAIKLDSRGPVLFRQERLGYRGRPFTIYKFRSMRQDAERLRMDMAHLNEMAGSGPLFKMRSDPRVTRVGRFLRKTSLDELPQLLNVMNGSMSLVGPRPFVTHEAEQIDGWAARRLDLMPGITGLWQVEGRNDVPFDDMVRLDYTYVANWSPWWDLRILMQTIPTVLTGKGAS